MAEVSLTDKHARALVVLTAACLVSCAAPAGVPADAPRAESRSAAGDVIVKFADASGAGKELAPVMSGEKTLAAPHPAIESVFRALSVPVQPLRVTSGRELVLGIDRAEIERRVAHSAERKSDVQRLIPIEAASRVLPSGELNFVVQLKAGSDAQRQLSRHSASSQSPSPEVRTLVEGLAGKFEPQASYSVDARNQLVLTLDLSALTQTAVDELRGRPEVEYAQPNLILKPTPRPPSKP